MKMERKIMLNMDMVNGKVEAVGSEGRAAHGSVVGATIRGWRMPGVIGAGWKVSEILLSQQNLPTLGTPEEPSSLRHNLSTSTAVGMYELRLLRRTAAGSYVGLSSLWSLLEEYECMNYVLQK